MLPRIIPVLTIINGQIYRTKKFKSPKYVGDPINAVKIFNEKKVDELVIFDIGSKKAIEGSSFIRQMQNITQNAFMPLAYGGGIKTMQDVERVFESGFDKVILSNSVINDDGLIKGIANRYGSQSVAFCLDLKSSALFGTYINKMNPLSSKSKKYLSKCRELEHIGIGELIIRDISHDGMNIGINTEIIKEISEAVNIPVIATGGVYSLEHIAMAIEAGAHSVAAGNMFVYQGKREAVLISYPNEDIMREV